MYTNADMQELGRT